MWDAWIAQRAEEYPDICCAASKKEWMESDIFLNYFSKAFLELHHCGSERPLLLIYDGHSTVLHTYDRVIKVAVANNQQSYSYHLLVATYCNQWTFLSSKVSNLTGKSNWKTFDVIVLEKKRK